jgi:hypothetical protein
MKDRNVKPRAVFLLAILVLGGCAVHTYSAPVATTYTLNGEQQDVAWILEDDGHHILRCVESPDGPRCIRAQVGD